jgi:simple sugar transport system ATP-binding protein
MASAGATASAASLALELEGIDKAYGDCVANAGAALRVARGSIHALVGENGAGKSTLLRIAYGELRADRGRLRVLGREVNRASWSPARAIAAGIGMVHQHFMLVPTLTVAENVVLGDEPHTPLGLLDLRRAVDDLRALGARLGLTVWPEARVGDLSVGEQQRVEIVKVLWRGADVLLLDEPTAVLSPPEVEGFLRTLRALREHGKTVILCTHRLDEVAAVADRVTVMRKGGVVATLERDEASPQAIARAMLGGEPPPPVQFTAATPGDVVLAVSDLVVPRPGAADAVAGVSLAVRGGEIVGVAGVEGNGQSELVLAIAGLVRPRAGRVRVAGREVTTASPAARAAAGLGHVPDDRHARGVVLGFSVAENLVLGRQREWPWLVHHGKVGAFAARLVADFGVVPTDVDAPLASLSGGNQQKVVVARELTRPGLRALLLAQPTRGVDLGAADLIRRRVREVRDAGAGVLLVSSDLAELRELCDRIVVMRRGRIAGEVARGAASDDALGALMTGAEA